jgi:hypothetical protein
MSNSENGHINTDIMARIPVIYILASSHGGSTLLDLLLGSHPEIESVGEIERFYRFLKDFRENEGVDRRCTCGEHVENCKFWGAVRNEVLSGKDAGGGAREEHFNVKNPDFYRAVLKVSGKKVLCDSSKSMDHLKFYRSHPETFDLKIIHLVRDGRAVAYSNEKKGRSYFYFLGKWQKSNTASARTLKSWSQENPQQFSVRIRYEDICRQPEKTIGTLMAQLGLQFHEQQLRFGELEHHNISGNHMRRNRDSGIRRDTRYLDAVGPARWFLASVLAFPLLRKFGYPFCKKKAAEL